MDSYGAAQGPAGREPLEQPHASRALGRRYRRHEADKTVLYQIVSQHLETFLDEVHDQYDKPLPSYVEKELRDFLKCGLLPYGYVLGVCSNCGRQLFVPLSRSGTVTDRCSTTTPRTSSSIEQAVTEWASAKATACMLAM